MAEADLDAYAVLGVAPTASQAELKAAHRRLVRRHHPDLVAPEQRAAATRRVQRINVAYGLVRDPESRAAYDALRRERERAAASRAAQEDLARRWEAMVGDAGRWAGRWWSRRRRLLRRAAERTALRARRSAAEAVAMLQWLLLAALGSLAGIGLALAAARLLDVPTGFAQLVGLVAGWAAGWSQGRRRRLARIGVPGPALPWWPTPAVGALAIAATLWVDARLF
ncbi:MAG: J domain-containing protein [Actinomycetota bacterium]